MPSHSCVLVPYCQATGTGDGDGNPVQGDDSIISQYTIPTTLYRA